MEECTHFFIQLLKTKDPLLIDLITKTLVYSPIRRITPAEALFHEYFDDLIVQKKRYDNQILERKFDEIIKPINLCENTISFSSDIFEIIQKNNSTKIIFKTSSQNLISKIATNLNKIQTETTFISHNRNNMLNISNEICLKLQKDIKKFSPKKIIKKPINKYK